MPELTGASFDSTQAKALQGEMQSAAATAISSGWRGHAARARIMTATGAAKEEAAALMLQCAWRQSAAQRRVRRLQARRLLNNRRTFAH